MTPYNFAAINTSPNFKGNELVHADNNSWGW